MVFLLDSGYSAETMQMVSLFMENMENEDFSKMIQEEFVQMTDRCIENFLYGNVESLFVNMKSLSTLVLKYFNPMIPADFKGCGKRDRNQYLLFKTLWLRRWRIYVRIYQDFKAAQNATWP